MARVSLNNKGFTLLEVLVALLVLAVILLGNLAALNLAQRWNLKSILRNEALSLAKRCLEGGCAGNTTIKVRNIPVNYIVTFSPCTSNSTFFNDLGLKCHSVIVSWDDPYGESHNVTLTTYVP